MMTWHLMMTWQVHSKQTILHYDAQYMLDENETVWFIGGANIITQRTPMATPLKAQAAHIPMNPTLQVRTTTTTSHHHLPPPPLDSPDMT